MTQSAVPAISPSRFIIIGTESSTRPMAAPSTNMSRPCRSRCDAPIRSEGGRLDRLDYITWIPVTAWLHPHARRVKTAGTSAEPSTIPDTHPGNRCMTTLS